MLLGLFISDFHYPPLPLLLTGHKSTLSAVCAEQNGTEKYYYGGHTHTHRTHTHTHTHIHYTYTTHKHRTHTHTLHIYHTHAPHTHTTHTLHTHSVWCVGFCCL